MSDDIRRVMDCWYEYAQCEGKLFNVWTKERRNLLVIMKRFGFICIVTDWNMTPSEPWLRCLLEGAEAVLRMLVVLIRTTTTHHSHNHNPCSSLGNRISWLLSEVIGVGPSCCSKIIMHRTPGLSYCSRSSVIRQQEPDLYMHCTTRCVKGLYHGLC